MLTYTPGFAINNERIKSVNSLPFLTTISSMEQMNIMAEIKSISKSKVSQCETCNVEFQGRPNKIYCSPRCKRRMKKRRRQFSTKRLCKTCGNGITNGGYKYCSDECKPDKNYYQRVTPIETECKECGKPIDGRWGRLYCGDTCKFAARDKRPKKETGKHRNGIYRECPVCGKIYHVTDYLLTKGWKEVCSNECQKKSVEVVVSCQNCGCDIVTTKSNADTHFCSRKCQSLWRRKESEKLRARTCKWCGKEFVMNQPSGKAMKGKVQEGLFCSRECRFADMKDKSGWFEYEGQRVPPGLSCPVYFKECDICGEIFTARMPNAKYCSDECSYRMFRQYQKERYKENWTQPEPFECKECGRLYQPKFGEKNKVFCSIKCGKRYMRKYRGSRDAKDRARQYGVKYESINPFKVFKRDSWHCQICGKPTPKKNRGTRYTNAPELDHRIPISKGGDHLYSNVQCSCRECNGLKSNNNNYGQLPLFNVY